MNETDYGVTFMDPAAIEKRSMEIIESELTVPLSEDIKPIVKRVIHTTADFSFAENMRFTPGVVELIRNILYSGIWVRFHQIRSGEEKGKKAPAFCDNIYR